MASPAYTDQAIGLLGLRDLLNAAEDAAPGAVVEVVARQLLASVGATEVGFLIADFSGESLFPTARVLAETHQGARDASVSVSIHDSNAGTALRRQRTQIVPDGAGSCMYAPVTCRGDAIGVLELRLPEPPSPACIDEVSATAHALAYIVIANRRHTDLFEWGQRTHVLTLAAEVQRRLTPGSFACEAGQFTLAGWLEPSVESAGDTFDYSFDSTDLSLSLTDAMGHAVDAALLATLGVSALRNARRSGAGIADRAVAANEALLTYGSDGRFVTGLLANIPLDGGVATIVNAGHPPPFLFRDGNVLECALDVDLPFGVAPDTQYRAQRLDLQIGDRLVLVTDGLLERGAATFDITSAIRRLAELHPREFVRELCRGVSAAAGGTLQDDATVLCLDWHGGSHIPRTSTSGSDTGFR